MGVVDVNIELTTTSPSSDEPDLLTDIWRGSALFGRSTDKGADRSADVFPLPITVSDLSARILASPDFGGAVRETDCLF